MMNEPPGQVALSHARAGPIDYLRRQHAVDAKFFANGEKQNINGSRIGVGQFSKITDAHHHLCIGVFFSEFKIAPEACYKAKADRFENWIDSQPHAVTCEELNGVVETGEGTWIIWHCYDLASPIDSGVP